MVGLRQELSATATYAAAVVVVFLLLGLILANVHASPFGIIGFVIGLFLIWPWFAVAEIPGIGATASIFGFLATYLWAFSLVSLIRFILRRRKA